MSIIILIGAFPITAFAENNKPRVLRVGYYQATGFQEYDGETDEYSGYGYEFLMALAQYTDWTYEFVPCGFSEGLQMLQDGELDLMNNVSKTYEREQVMNFSSLDSGNTVAYLAMHSGDSRVSENDLKAMESIKIGLAEDSLYSNRLLEYFKANGVNADIEWFPTHDELNAAFAENKIDAYIITSSTITDEHIILSFSPESYFIATSAKDSNLAGEIDRAITALRHNDPAFEVRLNEKYYGKTTEDYTILTEDEKEYIEQNATAKVLYIADWYPICYMDDNGEFAGALRGVYDLLEQRTGLKFEYFPDDGTDDILTAGGMQILSEQPTDFSRAEQYGVKLTKSFITPPLVEVADHVTEPGDTIILVEDDYLSKLVENRYGSKYNYIYTDSVEHCVDAVKKGKADATVLISYESEYYRQMGKYSNLLYTIVDVNSYSLSIAVFKDEDPRLYSIIQKGMNSISEDELTNIFNQTLIALEKHDLEYMVVRNPIQSIVFVAAVMALIVGLLLVVYFMRKFRKQNVLIQEKNAELENANRAKTDFLSRVSHDMRTPLNGILGLTTLLSDSITDECALKDLGELKMSGEYLLELINDTLDMSRIESGKLELHPVVCDAKVLFDNTLSLVKTSVNGKNIKLNIKTEGMNYAMLYVDVSRIEQVVMNVVGNAVKFTPEGGTIDMMLSHISEEDGVFTSRFTVKDTGIGISPEFLPHIFDAFSQENASKTGSTHGTGLGMAITKQILLLSGGDITVESEPGKGSRFTITMKFPRATQEQIAEWKENMTSTDAVASLARKRVLLCEDHPLNTKIATRLLEAKGVIVDHAENGREGVARFADSENGYYDAVLMDIRMPVMDGIEAAKAIRSLSRSDAKAVPIIAMTANAFADDIEQTKEAGMNAHLSKPIQTEALYRTLNAFFSNGH